LPTYSYRCPVCGPRDLLRPMAHAASVAACPTCEREMRRVYGAPALRHLNPAVRSALDASARSADAPDVVSAVPTGPRDRRRRPPTRYTTDPRHARLPRP
jgi:putative FmdB family regulatory protein